MKPEGKNTRTQKIYNYLKFSILNKEIAPGTQLVEAVIAERLKVSRTPIRAAFQLLVEEGIVNLVANKGAFVIRPTAEEIAQVHDVRRDVERMGIRYGYSRVTPEDIEILQKWIDMETQAYINMDITCYFDCNLRFHTYLAEKSGNAILQEITRRVVSQSNVYLTLYDILHHEGPPESAEEHRGLVTALKSNDPAIVEKEFITHIDDTQKSIEKNKDTYKSLEALF